MQLFDLHKSGKLSPEMMKGIVEHFKPYYGAKVHFVDTSVIDRFKFPIYHTVVDDDKWTDGSYVSESLSVETRTKILPMEKFGSYYGERVKACYDAESETLYIDIIYPFILPIPDQKPRKPDRKPVWHQEAGESLWLYGDRMFKTCGDSALIDDPLKRLEYSKAVVRTMVHPVSNSLKGVSKWIVKLSNTTK